MTIAVLQLASEGDTVEQLVQKWTALNPFLVQRWRAMLTDLKSAGAGDYPMVAVAMRELLDLAQAARHSGVETESGSAQAVPVEEES